jgi:glycerol-3-phosphate dehydrogenase subunit B
MAIESDVLVIGGGLGGVATALAATETGAHVRLVSYKQPTLRHASGLVDVMGYTPEGEGPLVDPYDAVTDLPEGHPYERAGSESIRSGLDLFDDVVGDAYEGGHTRKNALVPTHGGTIKPTARYPKSAAAGLASDSRDALLVGFERLVDFDAELAAEHLAAVGAPFRASGVTIEFPIKLSNDPKITRFAHLLDRDDESVRETLAETVREYLDDEERVGFPAVLGDDHAEAVRTDLEDHLGVDVFEIPMGPPSLPGLRLEDRLYDALDEAGVSIATGNAVVGYEGEDVIEAIYADHNGSKVPYSADQYVLATGGLVGKGIDSDREGVEEPIFGCHIPHPSDRYDWFDMDAFGDHPFARFGVDVDRELRPRGASGDTDFSNLRAAGAVLGGYDFAAEKSGSGVSLATGHRAGTRAGEEAA